MMRNATRSYRTWDRLPLTTAWEIKCPLPSLVSENWTANAFIVAASFKDVHFSSGSLHLGLYMLTKIRRELACQTFYPVDDEIWGYHENPWIRLQRAVSYPVEVPQNEQ